MAKHYEVSRANRSVNVWFAAMTRVGLGKPYRHILTVSGRRTGKLHSTPVDVMAADGHRWLVAGYGVVNWVRNLRVAGEATLERGRRTELIRASELDPTASVPVLRRYLVEVPVARPYFDVTADAADEVLIAEAPQHPVFEIVPASPSPEGRASTRRPDRGSRLSDQSRTEATMRRVLPWVLISLLIAHGAIHVLGAVKGLDLATVDALTEPISTPLGVAWLTAGIVVIVAAVLIARRARGWWYVAAGAAVLSEAVILTSWTDAKAGTAINVLLLLAAVYGYARHGHPSFREEYRRRVAALQPAPRAGVLTEDDLAPLPEAVARYIRRSGSVGQLRATDFRARIHGRIRGGPDKPWMPFTGEQLNTCAPDVRRLFLMDARMFGLPVDVLHVFEGSATMRVKVCGLVSMIDAAGEEMDRGETVTVFNDLCVMAPGALVDMPIRWEELDDRHVRGWFTHRTHTVSAVLTFDADGDLTDFVSDDRLRASPNGKTFTQQRWSTPVRTYRTFRGRRVATAGLALWHAPAPEGIFTYLEFEIDDIAYNAGPSATSTGRGDDQELGLANKSRQAETTGVSMRG
jgi:deazaflavin-dependent oxidoreductase (nitroreductase family)